MSKEKKPAQPSEPVDDADDTEGHSLQMGEFGRTMARERAREAEQAARESRIREEAKSGKPRRGLFRR